MELPVSESLDPSEEKIEEKSKKVSSTKTRGGLVMQFLTREIKDHSLFSPINFRENVCAIWILLIGKWRKSRNSAKNYSHGLMPYSQRRRRNLSSSSNAATCYP
jgi:hypothetical protein